jgi:hypothetical protein
MTLSFPPAVKTVRQNLEPDATPGDTLRADGFPSLTQEHASCKIILVVFRGKGKIQIYEIT